VPLLLVGFVVLVALTSQRARVRVWLEWLAGRISVLHRLQLTARADQFLDGLVPLSQPALLLRALFWTAVSWGFSLAAGYIVMFAFYDRAEWSVTALYIAAAAFAIAVPAVPGNIGTYEWAIMLAVSAMGLGSPTDPANVSFGVVVHALNLLVYALMGTLGFIWEGITLGQLTAKVEELDYKPTS
ncbi:MAG: lysylphosphatidylglycerol synthase domain-containing protein, partial [Anaerolineae bacterium]|nr:lysylphosphatidylglycerol synthase domain-containing protein [Anaerolineae bacterium]